MKCPACGTINRGNVRFCEECGAQLKGASPASQEPITQPKGRAKKMPRRATQNLRILCRSCGNANRVGIQFCEECGTKLTVDPASYRASAAGARKSVGGFLRLARLALRLSLSAALGFVTGKLGILGVNSILSFLQ